MVDKNSEVKLVDNAQAIKCHFGGKPQEETAKKLARAVEQKAAKKNFFQATGSNLMQLIVRFLYELGYGSAQSDAQRKSKMLAANLCLQKEIDLLQADLHEEITEISNRAHGYIHAAETAKDLVHDAEYFVASNLLRLVRGKQRRSS
jgi:hypothetical protein